MTLNIHVEAEVVYEQPIDLSIAGAGAESNIDDQTPPDIGVESADNFFLNTRTALIRIDWWGDYDVAPISADDFTLRIFSDNGGIPSDVPLVEYTGIQIPRIDTMTVGIFGMTIYRYSTDAVASFELDPGIYYLSIVNKSIVFPDPALWFWTQGVGTDSTSWFRSTPPDLPDAVWTTPPEDFDFDLAFSIMGNPVDGASVPILPTIILMSPLAALLGYGHKSEKIRWSL